MTKSINIKRFVDAQDGGVSFDRNRTAYQVALKEILDGEKISHWIWYIFPQGPFGTSAMSEMYAITSPLEATAYLQHPVLRSRLLEITLAVADQLKTEINPETLMGSSIDCQKLASSMTLFKFIADDLDDQDLSNATKKVLDQAAAHGWGQCTMTLNWLQKFLED